MKKKWMMVWSLFFVINFSFFAFAAVIPTVDMEHKVYDYADLYSEEEEEALQSRAEEIISQWNMDLVFLTTETTEDLEANYYAAEFYSQNGFGIGEDSTGIIMIVDMGERVGQIVTSGKAIDIFTDYYIERIWNQMAEYLSNGDYYGAMTVLCDNIEYYNREYETYQEHPDSYISEYQSAMHQKNSFGFLGIAAIVSLIIAAVGVGVMKRGNQNIRPYTDGRAYLKENGFFLREDKSTFAGTHTSRTPIPKKDDHHHTGGGGHSWGGGSSTFSSGGRSFGGGGGKF